MYQQRQTPHLRGRPCWVRGSLALVLSAVFILRAFIAGTFLVVDQSPLAAPLLLALQASDVDHTFLAVVRAEHREHPLASERRLIGASRVIAPRNDLIDAVLLLLVVLTVDGAVDLLRSAEGEALLASGVHALGLLLLGPMLPGLLLL